MAVEHKSAGKDLDEAMQQLIDYLPSLTPAEHPWLLVACDFQRFKWQNLDNGDEGEFALADLPDHLDLFWWLAGYNRPHERWGSDEEANLFATDLLAAIHDRLKDNGYDGQDLREWMTRILFILFADDAGIWDRAAFHSYIALHTQQDGSDLGSTIEYIFQILDTPPEKRQAALPEELRDLTYVNGDIFASRLRIPSCDAETRNALLWACNFNWATISPAIFGSLFQNVMESRERRQIGAHYTTEANILKVIEPLFLDDLWAELETCTSAPKLTEFHNKLGEMTFIDPACGCGNFLVIAYREIRKLETETLRRLAGKQERRSDSTGRQRGQRRAGQRVASLEFLCKVKVDQFYGIEIDEWPARIARTAMYLVDHLANREVSTEFGQHFIRFPIPAAPHIVVDNALRIDWTSVLPDPDWVFGNPPFVDRKNRDDEQKADHALIHGRTRGAGNLDYVTCWFVKAAEYMRATGAESAFVATNSITQGSQVPPLWPGLIDQGVVINFAYRTFEWTSEARGRAHVHVVIIGMGVGEGRRKLRLWDYPNVRGEGVEKSPRSISPYLTDNDPIVVQESSSPLGDGLPQSTYGCTAGDFGFLIFDADEVDVARADPVAKQYLKLYIGADEFFEGRDRWVLWLADAPAGDMRRSPLIRDRVAEVRERRQASNRPQTQRAADEPWNLLEARAPTGRYLFVPCVSSERREYVPMDFRDTDTLVRASSWFIEGADEFLFGVLHSAMFMAWVRNIGGRLKSDYQLSAKTVYNTFPMPSVSADHRRKITEAAEGVMAARDNHPGVILEDLYDPMFMPADLREAHNKLDGVVDAAIGPRRKFMSDGDRVSFLLDEYEARRAKLAAPATKKARRRRATT